MENDEYKPTFDNVKVIKHLYSTKLSKVWLVNYQNEFCILKGKEIKSIGDSDYTQLKRERVFLETNKHTEFPHFKKALKDDSYLYLLLSFFEGCTMSSLLLDKVFAFNKYKDNTDFVDKKRLYLYFIIQVIEIIEKLHQDSVIYRDLKMNNIIINEKLKLSLVDFGLIKVLESDKTMTVCGTYHIMAPEMLRNKFNDPEGYSFAIDIYSYGIFLYELFTGKPPFDYVYDFSLEYLESYNEIISKGIQDSHFDCFNGTNIKDQTFIENLKDLIKGCLNVAPEKRYSIIDIKSHILFENNYNDNRDYKLVSNKVETEIIEYIKFHGEFGEDYQTKEDPFDLYF
jgi:serine/threonine protein kinase